MRLDDPDVVRRQYAREDGLLARRAIYDGAEGEDARDVLFDAVAASRPRRVLEAGCGPGELAERLASELGVDVVAVDVSPRMVELARARGVDARVADVQALPFADGAFDCAVAAWMLFHVPDLDRALAELHRVLRPGGNLAAATNSERHLEEAWALVGGRPQPSFTRENGEELLRRRFARVRRRDVDGTVTFPNRAAVRAYFESTIVGARRADDVPPVDGPVRAGRRATIFVAETAA